MNAFAAVEATYGEYFMDPAAYNAAHNTTDTQVRQAIDQAFQSAFNSFRTGMASSNDDITALKSSMVTAFKTKDSNFNENMMPQDFGKYYDFSTNQPVNWPIPQVVMMNWVANNIKNGGGFSYTQDTNANSPIPTHMQWLGICVIPTKTTQGDCPNTPIQFWTGSVCQATDKWDQQNCQNAGNTWTKQRRNYNGDNRPQAFTSLFALRDDIEIIENLRYEIYRQGEGNEPTRAEEVQAKSAFQNRLDAAAERISGKTDATTDITTAQKKAVIKLMMQPSMN
jgi:hypothetical protein